MEGFCRRVRFKGMNVPTLWHEYNSRLKPNPRYDYFSKDIPTPKLKPYHFNPALSDGNIEQVYGKLRPRAVHHMSVMAPAFKIGVWGAGGGELYGQFHRESERISNVGQFWGQYHRVVVASWAWVVVIHDIARFNTFSRMLRRARARDFSRLSGGDLTVKSPLHIYLNATFRHTFKEVLFFQAKSSWLALFSLGSAPLYLSLTPHPPPWLPVALSGRG